MKFLDTGRFPTARMAVKKSAPLGLCALLVEYNVSKEIAMRIQLTPQQ